MRICHGLLSPSSGRVAWSGAASPGGAPRQAMVFQRPVMLRRSALDNVAYALALAGVAAPERGRRAWSALERVGLAALAARPARVLSGGEQQRLALARAWALVPEVLFLDEPTASLDPTSTREVEAIIAAIHAAGTKIIMTTHSLGQARRLGDEILFLDQGRLLERAPVERFFSRPQTAQADAFIKGELPWN
jgi:tungstate transport system ATP-binding protein